jgi:hypothetical protein
MDQQTTQSGDRLSELADSSLISRLARRATAPIGVIDTRHPQYLHTRASDWAAERLGWTERLRARYIGEESGSSGHGLLYAGAAGRLPNKADGTESASSDGLWIARQAALPDALWSSASTALVSRAVDSSQSLARVSRRGPQRPPNAILVQRKADADSGPRSSGSAPAFRPDGQSLGEGETSISSSSPPPRSLDGGQIGAGHEAQALQVNFARLPARGATAVQRRVAERQIDGETTPIAGGAAISAMPLLFPVTGKVDVQPAAARSEGAARDPAARHPGSVSGSEAVTGRTRGTIAARSSSTPAPLIQRRSVDRGAGQPFPVPSSESVIRAPELPSIIRRTPESGNEQPSVTGYLPIRQAENETPSVTSYLPLRQAESTSPTPALRIETGGSASESGPAVRQTAFTAPAQSPALNLALLAEQVSRIIARQLEAERERRGLKR